MSTSSECASPSDIVTNGKYNIPYVERKGIFYPCIGFQEDAPIGKVGIYGLLWIAYMK